LPELLLVDVAAQAFKGFRLQHVSHGTQSRQPLAQLYGRATHFFSQAKTLDVITLFHNPSKQASVRAQTILKQASAQASQHATEDQASDHSGQHQSAARDPFELEVTESAPTADQLKSIFEYVGNGKAAALVSGAASESDALRMVKENGGAFIRPVVVDWSSGKAVIGDNESEILKMLKNK
jgi:arsenate reductase-like glutaredoxin family protein